MPKTEDDKGAKIKWDFPNPPMSPKPSGKGVPPFPIKPETSSPQVETVVSTTSTQTRSSNEPEIPSPAQASRNAEPVPEPAIEAQVSEESPDEQSPSEKGHWLINFLSTFGVSVALLLCIGLIFSLGFLFWQSIQRQSKLENSIIESERRQASSMLQLKDELLTETKNTRMIVQERISSMDASQALLEKRFLDSEKHAALLQEQIDLLSKSFQQEKQARENEMALLLNLTRVRINSIEKRQQELEKSSEPRNTR